MTPESFILTAIAVTSAIASLLSLRSNNRRTDTDTKNLEDTITERVLVRADAEIAVLTKQIAELREELRARDEIIEAQNVGIGILLAQLVKRKIEPEWRPAQRNATSSPALPAAPSHGFKS
jgi:hypothetical protein